MEFTKKYFNTVEEGEAFIQQINTLLGIPINDEADTRTYNEIEADKDGIYVDYETYIGELLGEPIQIEVNEN
jgi:hypothetical protein